MLSLLLFVYYSARGDAYQTWNWQGRIVWELLAESMLFMWWVLR